MDQSRRVFALLGAFVLLLSGSQGLRAQSVTSSLGGGVQDSTGAVIPGAQVTLTDVNTGTVLTTKTDAAGSYAFPSILVGTYQLTVSKEGFTTYQLSQFKVEAAEHAIEDVILKVGNLTQTVTVEGGGLANLLQTGSNELGNLVEPQSVAELPLNGRDYLQLGLISGATQSTPSSASMASQYVGAGRSLLTINVAGNENDFTMYLIDGIQTEGSRAGNSSLGLSLGAIDQFEVQYGFFLPDLGTDPGVVDVITKSGTNQVHGEAYEYVRNNDWSARNFFSPTPPGPFHRNQFGGDVGGPIKKDKLFYFGNYEGLRQVLSGVSNAFHPTESMFQGNFSALSTPIYNPFSFNSTTDTRTAFTGNVIPPSMINPVSQKLLQYYLPGASYTEKPNNVFTTPASTLDYDQFTAKVDDNVSNSNRIFAEFSYENSPATAAGLNPLQGTSYPLNTELAALGWTSTLSPSKVNELRLGFMRDYVYELGQVSPGLAPQLGITGTADTNGVPLMGISGVGSFGSALGRLGDVDDSYQVHDSFSWLHGNHTIRIGGDLNYYRSVQDSSNGNARGNFTFADIYSSQLTTNASGAPVSAANTGNAFADFLLGLPSSAYTTEMPHTHYRWTNFQPYIQDAWKIRPNLTLNVGLAYFLTTPPNPQGADKDYPHSFNFQTGHITYAAIGQISPEVYSLTTRNFAPRVGLAWEPGFSKNTVVRAGWGIYYSQTDFFDSQFSIVGPGVTVSQNIANAEPSPTYVFGTNVLPPISIVPITTQFANTATGTLFYVPPVNPTPYVEQWTADVQHSFGRHYLLDVAYLGNQGHHLLDEFDPNDCYQPSTLTCTGPLPYPAFTDFLEAARTGNSNFNGLLVKFRRQFSNGFSVLVNYTYSKTLTIANEGGSGSLNEMGTCRECDYGPALYSIPEALVVSTVWQLPVGRGGKYLSNANKFLNAAVAGWGVDFISTFQKGYPFTVTMPNTTAYQARNIRANRLCNGRSGLSNQNLRTNGLVYIETSCFPQPTTGTLGNSGQAILTGPGLNNWDIGVHKDFRIHEAIRLQFRGEFFNAFNHAQFSNPNSGATDAAFGEVGSTQTDARDIQLGARLTF